MDPRKWDWEWIAICLSLAIAVLAFQIIPQLIWGG